MINGRSRSILLQVAFKEAARTGGDIAAIRILTAALYNMLIELHGELEINPDDGFSSRGGSGGRRTTPTTPTPVGETFVYAGTLVEDFRAAKAAPGSTVKPNFPDFKTVNGEPIEGVTTPKGAAWLYTQSGEAVEEVAVLVAAADTKVF